MNPNQSIAQDVPNQSQDPVPQADPSHNLSQDQLSAALGFITTLGTQHHMAQQQMMNTEASASPQNAPTATQDTKPQEDLTPRLDSLENEFKGLKDEVAKEIKDGLKEVKTMIQEAIQNEPS